MSERTRSKATASAKSADVKAVTFPPYTIRRHHEQLAKWVKANGIDPHDVPLDYPLRVEEGEGGPVIRYHAYLRSDDGSKQVDPMRSGQALTVERTAPCTVPPPDLGAARTKAGPSAEAGT